MACSLQTKIPGMHSTALPGSLLRILVSQESLHLGNCRDNSIQVKINATQKLGITRRTRHLAIDPAFNQLIDTRREWLVSKSHRRTANHKQYGKSPARMHNHDYSLPDHPMLKE